MPASKGLAPSALEQRLSASLAGVGCSAEPAAWELLSAYCLELVTWNQRINLTAARSAEDVSRQVEECLPLLPHLPARTGARVVDVGAGGGLPGLVLASFRPELAWCLVEPIRKKHAFLRAATRAMGLKLETRAVRDEALGEGEFDAALTRATWPMDEWLQRGRRLVGTPGRVLGLEGKDQRELPAAAERFAYQLGSRERVAVVLDVE